MKLRPGDAVKLNIKGVRIPGVVRRWDGAARVVITTKAGDLSVDVPLVPAEAMRRFDS